MYVLGLFGTSEFELELLDMGFVFYFFITWKGAGRRERGRAAAVGSDFFLQEIVSDDYFVRTGVVWNRLFGDWD